MKSEPVSPSFVITRTFAAPRARVWAAWTQQEHMSWWGPKGVAVERAVIDLRPGGRFHYCMKTPDGQKMWGRWMIREVTPPAQLLFVNSFSDEAGGVTRHPLSPNWPLELFSKITFVDKGAQTEVTVEWTPLNATATERQTFDSSHASMQGGWTGTLDRLAEYLAQA